MKNSTDTSSKSGLFSKVSLLLTCTLLVSAAGTYLGAGITSYAAILALAVLFFLGAFLVPAAAKVSTASGLAALSIWTFISGLFLGPCIHSYVHALGWQTVCFAYLGTAGVMAICGAIGALSGLDFSNIGRWLLVALLVLIVVGIANIFIAFSQTINIVYCSVGMVVFAGFFLFDFFRLSKENDTWFNATELTMSIYLDYINFLLFLLRLLLALGGSSSSSSSSK